MEGKRIADVTLSAVSTSQLPANVCLHQQYYLFSVFVLPFVSSVSVIQFSYSN